MVSRLCRIWPPITIRVGRASFWWIRTHFEFLVLGKLLSGRTEFGSTVLKKAEKAYRMRCWFWLEICGRISWQLCGELLQDKKASSEIVLKKLKGQSIMQSALWKLKRNSVHFSNYIWDLVGWEANFRIQLKSSKTLLPLPLRVRLVWPKTWKSWGFKISGRLHSMPICRPTGLCEMTTCVELLRYLNEFDFKRMQKNQPH